MSNNSTPLRKSSSVEFATKLTVTSSPSRIEQMGWPTVTNSPYRPSTKDGKSRFFPGGDFQTYPLPVDAGPEVAPPRSRSPRSSSGNEDGGKLKEGYGDDVDGIPFGTAELWVDELTREASDENQESPVSSNEESL